MWWPVVQGAEPTFNDLTSAEVAHMARHMLSRAALARCCPGHAPPHTHLAVHVLDGHLEAASWLRLLRILLLLLQAQSKSSKAVMSHDQHPCGTTTLFYSCNKAVVEVIPSMEISLHATDACEPPASTAQQQQQQHLTPVGQQAFQQLSAAPGL
jgi:hypothetical protein